MKRVIVLLALLGFAAASWRMASAQDLDKLEVTGSWQHVTGDGGLNGLGLGAFYWLDSHVNVGVTYDTAWNTSRLGVFELSSIGQIAAKSHLQNFMIGPRVYFEQRKVKKYYFDPFAEVRFGGAHLSSTITQVGFPSLSASDSGFSWLLGGGADYVFNPHFSARFNLDFLRTHFVNAGQSHLQVGLGIGYTFGQRTK